MATQVLEIDGAERSLQAGSLRIRETLNGRNTMHATVVSMDASWRPTPRDEAAFEYGEALFFAGSVHQPAERGHQSVSKTPIAFDLQFTDYNELGERREIEVTLPAGTLKSWLEIIVTYLSGYGVTLHGSQATGSTYDQVVLERQTVASALNKLSVITGYTWEISYTKVLRMAAPGATSAPFNIAADDRKVIGDVAVRPTVGGYANRVRVRFTEAARSAYAFLSASANFADGDTVTVGGRIYTFQATLTNTNGNVLIGASAEASLDNLAAAITLGSGAGSVYAAATTVHGTVTAYMQSASLMATVALSAGVSGNSIALSEAASNALWITEGGGEVSTLQLGADESLGNVAIAENVSAQAGGANLVERTVSHPEVRDRTTAQLLANGYLVKFLSEPNVVSYETRELGLHPGQQQAIVLPRRNLNATFLITDVEVFSIGTKLRSKVTAVEGLTVPELDSEAFRTMLTGGTSAGLSIGSLVVGSGGGGTGFAGTHVLGGTGFTPLPMAGTPAYVAVTPSYRFTARTSFTALVRVWMWAKAAGVTPTARLRNITSNTTVGSATGSAVTAQPSSPSTFYASLVAGEEYELQGISDIGSQSIYVMGSLEAA